MAFWLGSAGILFAAGLGEYDVKAAFLFNFVQFVDWPPRAFASPDAPLVIGILGNDPFGGSLERIIRGESIHGHKLVVKRAKRPEDLRPCHVLFIAKSEANRVQECLENLHGLAVLTVADMDRFVQKGGMIGFVMAGNNVRFEINPGQAQREELRISSKLLKLAATSP